MARDMVIGCALLVIAGAVAPKDAAAIALGPNRYPAEASSSRSENNPLVDERVDGRLMSSSGDSDWDAPRAASSQQDIYARQLPADMTLLPVVIPSDLSRNGFQYQYNLPASYGRNYVAIAEDFKHRSPVANPARQSRAFKPRLMSTARGFGKRTPAQVPDPDKPVSSSYNNPEWASQTLMRNPGLDKYINDKFIDYNGDGVITKSEMLQSV